MRGKTGKREHVENVKTLKRKKSVFGSCSCVRFLFRARRRIGLGDGRRFATLLSLLKYVYIRFVRVMYAVPILGGCCWQGQSSLGWRTARRSTSPSSSTPSSFARYVAFFQRGGGGGYLFITHGRSRMTIDPRIPTMLGRSTSGFHRSGRHCFAPSAKRSAARCLASSMKGEMHPIKNRF